MKTIYQIKGLECLGRVEELYNNGSTLERGDAEFQIKENLKLNMAILRHTDYEIMEIEIRTTVKRGRG